MRGVGLCLTALLVGNLVKAASVSPADLAQCAGIATSDTRLACYDELAHRVAGSMGVAPAAPAPGAAAVVRAAPAAPPPAAASPAAPPPEAVPLDDPKNFGLSLNQLQRGQQTKAPTAGIKSIKAQITSLSPGATGHARIVLDNEQTWDVLDDDGGLKPGLEVSIRKATLGSFLMSAAHHVYRVHRVN